MPGQGSQVHPSPVVAGSFLSVAVVSGSVSADKVDSQKEKLENTKGIIESGDLSLLSSLTREDLLGDIFYAGILSYFSLYIASSHVSALQKNSHIGLAPSAGTYGYEPDVDYLFGFPRSIKTGYVAMDIDRVAIIVDASEGDDRRDLVIQLGALSSALEHIVPEKMFVTTSSPGEAISAVKAITKAAISGQRIYRITSINQTDTLSNINHRTETMDEIRTALAANKEVITHTDAVSIPGWSGAGYIIIDPDTGAGAYKIGGGKNGRAIVALAFFFIGAVLILSILGARLDITFVATLAFFTFASRVKSIVADEQLTDQQVAEEVNKAAFIAVLATIVALSGPLFAAGGSQTTGLQIFTSLFIGMFGFTYF